MKEKLKMYLPIIIMLVVALTAGILIWFDILHVDQIIAAVNDNRPLAALVIFALFAFKGCSCIPYAVILIGCALIFELPVAIAINTVGTVICISVSYLIGRFSKGLTFDGMMEKYPKFRRYFSNAEGYSFTFVGGSMAALIPSMLIYTVIGDKFDFTNPLFWAFVALDALTVVFGFVYAKKNLIDGGKKASEE